MQANESNSGEISLTLDQPDEPSPTLSYRTPDVTADAWLMLLKAFVIAAAVVGIAHVVEMVALAGRYGPGIEWTLITSAWGRHANLTSALASIGGMLGDLASIALIVAAVGCKPGRPWVRLGMVAGAMLLIAGTACYAFEDAFRDMRPSVIAYRAQTHYMLLYHVTGFIPDLVFPVLLIWFMMRPEVRRLFALSSRKEPPV